MSFALCFGVPVLFHLKRDKKNNKGLPHQLKKQASGDLSLVNENVEPKLKLRKWENDRRYIL